MKKIGKLLAVLGLLYIFLISVALLGGAFKLFGKDFARQLIATTSHPFIGLFIGIFVTSIIQSSSATTSMVVAFVSSGILSVEHAVPIVMGANIGTTITNTIVSLAQMTRKQEFRRSFSAGVIHDFFNFMSVLIIFPLELATGFLHKLASAFAGLFYGATTTSLHYHSPIKQAIKPIVVRIIHIVKNIGMSNTLTAISLSIFAFFVLFFSLFFLVKILKSVMLKKADVAINNVIEKKGYLGILSGILITMAVQSSSVTTSILVPMAGAGIVRLETVFPITLGANIGTTVTAILAALAGNKAGLTIAFVHLFFNIIGILIIYPIKRIRQIPINLARLAGIYASRKKQFAIIYILVIFFALPAILIFLF